MLNAEGLSLRLELEEAIRTAGIDDYYVENAQEIISMIKNVFVNDNYSPWWLSLKHRLSVTSYPDDTGYKNILRIVTDKFKRGKICDDNVFIIADEGNACMCLYKIALESLINIIENCRFFEYYIVPYDLSWLICENDHGDLIVCSRMDR